MKIALGNDHAGWTPAKPGGPRKRLKSTPSSPANRPPPRRTRRRNRRPG